MVFIKPPFVPVIHYNNLKLTKNTGSGKGEKSMDVTWTRFSKRNNNLKLDL